MVQKKSPVVLEGTSVEHVVLSQSSFETSMKINGGSKVQSVKSKMNSNIVVEDDSTIDTLETEAKTKVIVGKGVKIDKLMTKGATELETERGARISKLVAEADTKISGDNVVSKFEKGSKDVKIEDESKKTAVTPSKGSSSSSSSSSKRDRDDDDDDKKSSGSSNSGSNNGGGSNNSGDNGGTTPEFVKGPATHINNVEVSSNMIRVYFRYPYMIDKDAAADKRNYFIEGVGNPINVVVGSENVKLYFDKFEKNSRYKLEAYNISNMKEEVVENSSIEFIAVADSVDFGNPVLQDVEYLGKGRLYVTFDRGLRVSDLSSKQITVYDIANPDELITLHAAEHISYKKNTLVFKATASDLDLRSPLRLNTTYKINELKNIESIAFVKAVMEPSSLVTFSTDKEEFDVKEDGVELFNAKQVDGDTIHIKFNKPVKLKDSIRTIISSGAVYSFNMKVDQDDSRIVVLDKESGVLPDNFTQLSFDLTDIVTDLYDRPVYFSETGKVDVEVRYHDYSYPTVEYRGVLTNSKIYLEFDEQLSFKGSWQIMGANKTVYDTLSATLHENGKLVILELDSKEMIDDEKYILEFISSPTDLAGNPMNVSHPFWINSYQYVYGRSDRPVDEKNFVGLQILNATTAKVTGDKFDQDMPFDSLKLYENGVMMVPEYYTVSTFDVDTKSVIIKLTEEGKCFKKGNDYLIRHNDDKSAIVNGILKEDQLVNVTSDDANNTLVIIFAEYEKNYDAESYEYVLLDEANYTVPYHSQGLTMDSTVRLNFGHGFKMIQPYLRYFLVVKEDGDIVAISKKV